MKVIWTSPIAVLLLLLLLASTSLSSVAVAQVIELGVDNLAATIKSKTWTCLLFYDRNDSKENGDLDTIMSLLNDVFGNHNSNRANNNITLAKLDMRRHPSYREAYKYPSDPLPFMVPYYMNFPNEAESMTSISHMSFMDSGDMYFPAKILLMAHDFNVYSEFELDFMADASVKAHMLARWIETSTERSPDELEVLIMSPINEEREQMEASQDDDNGFSFERYFESLEEEEDEEEQRQTQEQDDEQQHDLRFLLEAGATKNADVDRDGHYRLKRMSLGHYDDSEEWLNAFAVVVSRYLSWVEGYETLWDDERKAREDEQTGFGTVLQQVDQVLHELVDYVFGPNYEPPIEVAADSELSEQELQEEINKKSAVPNLKPYIDEIIFGYGRSPTSIRKYMEEIVIPKLGPTAAARREARSSNIAHDFDMYQRLREYMKIVEETNKDGDLYLVPLADLVSNWYNIMTEFQDKLHMNYLEYLEKQSIAANNRFHRHEIQVINMEDPNNFDLLTNYDEFHRRFTKQAVPVVLGNVNMTDYEYTLDYLVEQCGASDITDRVSVSNPVGKESTGDWGGLARYVLDDDLLNEDRERDGNNRDLTLEQFITLSRRLDTVYLHDCGLPDTCDRILHEETLYDEHQKFRIPSVLAAYDLFHRVPLYGYASSWPSLFIGKKGSNSKLHVDSGASGFFMYLVSGRKRWIVTNPSERPFLYQRLDEASMVGDVLGIDKSEEANEFLSKRFPLLHRAEDFYEVIQEPGQLIYIPPDSPHAVENLEDIVGIALNLVPRDGLINHVHDAIHYDRKFGYVELALKYMLYEDNAEKAMPTKDPLYMTFAEYKGQV